MTNTLPPGRGTNNTSEPDTTPRQAFTEPRMHGHYILKGREIVNCEHMDSVEWARAYEAMGDRHLGDTTINSVRISTVFLGLDHSFGEEAPVLFETMVFGGKLDGRQQRYGTVDDAERGHARWVTKVRRAEQGPLERAIRKVRRKR
jgi:hypothetical protein